VVTSTTSLEKSLTVSRLNGIDSGKTE